MSKRVYILETKQVGIVKTYKDGKPETVLVQTPSGPALINVLEKGWKIINLLRGVLDLLLAFFKNFGTK